MEYIVFTIGNCINIWQLLKKICYNDKSSDRAQPVFIFVKLYKLIFFYTKKVTRELQTLHHDRLHLCSYPYNRKK